MNKTKLLYASSAAAILAIASTTAVTIWGELSPTFKNLLAGFTGHHWVTKSLLSLLVYLGGIALFYFLSKNINTNKISKGLTFLISSALICSLILFLFYFLHYL
ncbi:MAG TPA: hypothetical protein VI978_01770 [Candidatus Paceibacterota bacterium]